MQASIQLIALQTCKISGMETQIEDMRGLVPLAGNPPRQRGRQLRIHEEVHAGCSTAWSDWRAA